MAEVAAFSQSGSRCNWAVVWPLSKIDSAASRGVVMRDHLLGLRPACIGCEIVLLALCVVSILRFTARTVRTTRIETAF
jgi:hypothetical protein